MLVHRESHYLITAISATVGKMKTVQISGHENAYPGNTCSTKGRIGMHCQNKQQEADDSVKLTQPTASIIGEEGRLYIDPVGRKVDFSCVYFPACRGLQ